jgi:F0F1-type ATP synthase assembly protein I
VSADLHDPEPPPTSREEIMRRAGPYLGIGSTFLASIGFFLFAGWWLDRLLGVGPWLTVTGAFLGIAAGFYLFIKVVLRGRESDGGGPEGDGLR